MTQAQRKLEQTARVRSVPPPLPRRNHGGPAVIASVPSIKPRVSTPPPPPPAAFRSSRPAPSSVPPAPVTEPAIQLALIPQWEDANASLRPAPKKSKSVLYWVGSATVSIAVGALVAASLMNIRSGDLAQIMPNVRFDSPHASAAIAAQPPVQVAQIAPEVQTQVAAATQEPVLIEALTVTSAPQAKPSKPTSKRAKSAAHAARAAAPSSAQPDPQQETAAESVSEAETTPVVAVTEAAAEPVAAEPGAAAEPVAAAEPTPTAPEVSEPEAPALPEKLTRDQVRAGLDAMRSQVLQCANGTYGRVLADVTISAPGRVSHAVIEGTFAGTNAGSCMARTLRSAKFPAFAGQDISVRYPYSF